MAKPTKKELKKIRSHIEQKTREFLFEVAKYYKIKNDKCDIHLDMLDTEVISLVDNVMYSGANGFDFKIDFFKDYGEDIDTITLEYDIEIWAKDHPHSNFIYDQWNESIYFEQECDLFEFKLTFTPKFD